MFARQPSECGFVHLFDHQPDASYTCGYCDRDVTVPIVWQWLQNDRAALGVICSHCRQATVFNLSIVIGTMLRPDGPSDTYRNVTTQVPQPSLIEYPSPDVPESVARRFRDAQKALRLELWEQAISSARTGVQVMARLEGVDRGTLYQEIERLIEKRGDQLPGLIREMAHRIRGAGNDAVHPDDPEWSPTREEAVEALAFLEAVIEWLYAIPARLAATEKAPQEVETGPSTIENETGD
jgi:Domain of unknown function (DUF4145)